MAITVYILPWSLLIQIKMLSQELHGGTNGDPEVQPEETGTNFNYQLKHINWIGRVLIYFFQFQIYPGQLKML